MSKIQEVIDGAKIWNPEEGGLDNGRFIGYAVLFDSEDENGDQYTANYIVDENLRVLYIDTITHQLTSYSIPFEIQPEATKTHAVAYKLCDNANWAVKTMTDCDLNIKKQIFEDYRILETWFE